LIPGTASHTRSGSPNIAVRKRIYARLYARAVERTGAYAKLREMLKTETRDIYLRDWDGYDHLARCADAGIPQLEGIRERRRHRVASA
jgi:hypothetical protein